MVGRRVEDPDFLNGSFKSRSFVDALSSSLSPGCFPELRQGSFHGLPLLWISEEEIRALSVPFQFALVGFFPMQRASLDAIRNDFDLGFLSKSETPSFSPRILHALGSMFGRPLKIDNATYVGSRPSLVRVLVELDITKSFPTQIWLGPKEIGYIQNVQMEVFPDFYVSCKHLGHLRGECSSASLSNPLSIPIGNVKRQALVVSSLDVNEEKVGDGCDVVPVASAKGHVVSDIQNVNARGFNGESGNPVIDSVLEPLAHPVGEIDKVVSVVDLLQNPLLVDVVAGREVVDNPMDALVSPVVVLELVAPTCTTPCLLNLVTSPSVSPDLNVVISNGESKCSDDCVHLDLTDRECYPSARGILYPNCGEGVSVSILKSDALRDQLAYYSRNFEVLHDDWLNVDYSGGKEFDKDDSYFDQSFHQIADGVVQKNPLLATPSKIRRKEAAGDELSAKPKANSVQELYLSIRGVSSRDFGREKFRGQSTSSENT
ncbi:hypothetical protein IEQ34_002760 [Dendrobium chrysotoxum]|uniref:DUF4283 domain-containing protein n=1 Tax=Dendrobium chrysotoxum TaxID=161865 RepID=A0AAV7HFQ9_DENCH|nr:hypothetical protein IEQ34_002760 [Dendrobium chrysotoxum]